MTGLRFICDPSSPIDETRSHTMGHTPVTPIREVHQDIVHSY